MQTSDIIATLAAAISLASLAGAFLIARAQAGTSRLRHTAELHQQWWSPELEAQRRKVWELVEEHRSEGMNCRGIRFYQGDKEAITEDHKDSLARVLFFFSDLNQLIELRIVDKEATIHMFGMAQYEWFRPFIQDARSSLKERLSSDSLQPRWVEETEALETKIDATLRSVR